VDPGRRPAPMEAMHVFNWMELHLVHLVCICITLYNAPCAMNYTNAMNSIQHVHVCILFLCTNSQVFQLSVLPELHPDTGPLNLNLATGIQK